MRFQHIILCFVLMFSAACKTQRAKKIKIEQAPSTALQSQDSTAVNVTEPGVIFEPAEIAFDAVKLKSQIEIKSARLNQSFPANVSIRKDSIIWISVVVGLEVARGVIDQDSVFLLDRLNRKYYKFSFADLSRQFSFDLNYNLIQALILGNMPVKPDTSDIYMKEEGYNRILQKRKAISIENKIDIANNKLFSVEALDDSTGSQMTINYQDFVIINEKILPRLISVIVNGGGAEKPAGITSVIFQHSRLDFSTSDIKYPFSIPKSFTEGKINF